MPKAILLESLKWSEEDYCCFGSPLLRLFGGENFREGFTSSIWAPFGMLDSDTKIMQGHGVVDTLDIS